MEVWFFWKKEPRLRGPRTRRSIQRNLHQRSSEARQENFCPLDKDLSWKSPYRTCSWLVLHFSGNRVISNEAGRCKSFSDALCSDRTHLFVGARIASVSGVSVHLRSPYVAQPLRSSTWCCPPVISSIIWTTMSFSISLFQGGG